MRSFSPDAVSNEFLRLAERDERRVTPLKLQKLMYFAHGWHLALRDGPLVAEHVQAWDYGPVFPSTYHEFKDFGGSKIDRFASEVTWNNGTIKFVRPTIDDEAKPDESHVNLSYARAIIDRIWHVYGQYSAGRLAEVTHEEGTPWWIIREKAKREFQGRIPRGLNIPDEMIRDHFKTRFQTAAD